ncbi:MAG: hypothetical protein AB7T49_03680 [Oligoflexales bacterium]
MSYLWKSPVALLLMLLACKSLHRQSSTKNETEQSCTLTAGHDNNDGVAKAASANCSTNIEKMLLTNNCQTMGRNIVAERDRSKGRIIDSFSCISGDDGGIVFFAHPNEMIGMDFKTETLNFYKMEGTSLVFKGNSYSEKNECKKCHVAGGMVMKELDFPWRNWIQGREESGVSDLLGEDAFGQRRELMRPENLEGFVKNSFEKVGKLRLKLAKAGQPPFENYSLRDALKPLFCTTEINLVHLQPGANRDQSILPVSALYRNEFFSNVLASADMRDGAAEAAGPSEQEMKNYLISQNIDVSHNNFLTIVPGAGDSDHVMVDALWVNIMDEPYMDTSIIFAAVAVDIPNPTFSKKRCSVWKKLPETPFRQLENSAAITQELISKLQGDSDPAVKEFVKYLKDNQTETEPQATVKALAKRIRSYLTECAKPGSAVNDPAKAHRLLRSKLVPLLQEAAPLKYFDRIHVVENFHSNVNSPAAMFPEFQKIVDGEYANDEGLALNEQCQIIEP